MSRKSAPIRKMLTIVLMLAVASFYSMTLAQTTPKAAGELSVSGNVTINGTSAISGATVFNDSRIKTERNSGATINLGKTGRIQLGPDSEMTLRFTNDTIGGNLTSGRAVMNAPAGVGISVATADGIATADGKQASALTVDVTCGNTRVAATRNGAKISSGGKEQFVAAGSETAVGQAQAPRCARLSTAREPGLSSGAVAALIIAGVGGAVAGIVAASQSDNVTPSSIVVSGFRP